MGIINLHLGKVQEWCNSNKVTINLKKTSYCIRHYFRVQLFSRFWPGAVIREWLIRDFADAVITINRHKLKWKFTRGFDSRNSRK